MELNVETIGTPINVLTVKVLRTACAAYNELKVDVCDVKPIKVLTESVLILA